MNHTVNVKLRQLTKLADNFLQQLHFAEDNVVTSPTMGDRLVVEVGLMGSEDPADSAF